MAATTIDEVISELEALLAESIKNDDRIGFFTALYYKVTCKVKEGILKNDFEDGNRMEKLDVVFANRYLEALRQYKANVKPTGSWQVVFETSKKSGPLLLQHLLLGMNAHINLDLGIAAVEVTGPDNLLTIKRDFNAINAILASLTSEVMNEINRISPMLSLLGLHANNYNSMFIQFAMDNARDGAWCFAEELASLDDTQRNICIAQRDDQIKLLGSGMTKANFFLAITIYFIHLFEWKKPSKIIKAMNEKNKTFFKIKLNPAS